MRTNATAGEFVSLFRFHQSPHGQTIGNIAQTFGNGQTNKFARNIANIKESCNFTCRLTKDDHVAP